MKLTELTQNRIISCSPTLACLAGLNLSFASVTKLAAQETKAAAPDGKRLGFDPQTNKFYEEIEGGCAAEIVGGRGKTVPNLTILAHSSGAACQVTFSGKNLKKESTADFTYSAPGLTVGFDGIQLDPMKL